MIKIDNYHGSNYCKVYFNVEPNRPHQIPETKIGIALAEKLHDHYVTKEGEIFKVENSVPCSHSIAQLKEMQEAAQEQFSQNISRLKKKLDDFKLLQKLIKEEEKKI